MVSFRHHLQVVYARDPGQSDANWPRSSSMFKTNCGEKWLLAKVNGIKSEFSSLHQNLREIVTSCSFSVPINSIKTYLHRRWMTSGPSWHRIERSSVISLMMQIETLINKQSYLLWLNLMTALPKRRFVVGQNLAIAIVHCQVNWHGELNFWWLCVTIKGEILEMNVFHAKSFTTFLVASWHSFATKHQHVVLELALKKWDKVAQSERVLDPVQTCGTGFVSHWGWWSAMDKKSRSHSF